MNELDGFVSQLFEKALALPQAERAAFLEQTCREHPEVRQPVEALLSASEWQGEFRDNPQSPGKPPWNPTAETQQGLTGSQRAGPGIRLGRYGLIEALGSGGMGEVYRARDEKLERSVAVKVLRPGLLTSEAARGRFRREALALARLNHPNLAALYDVGEEGGVDYLVMEWIPGESLQEKLRNGPLPVREATRLLIQMAEALEEAHAQGVVHRDLKPANVMLTPREQAKVLDFGVARLLAGTDTTQSLPETGGLIGTPRYMSPEQALGRAVDARTDLWSLGVVYFEMLCGQSPFEGEGGVAVLRAITSDRVPSLGSLRTDVPVEAEQIVQRALEKDPARRYSSAAEMLRDARRLWGKIDGAVQALEEPKSTRLLRVVTATLALLLAVGALGGWCLYRRIAEERWAREKAIPEIESLMEARRAVPAFAVLRRAEKDLPGDRQLREMASEDTQRVTITSEPAGAEVAIQDYLTPEAPKLRLGTTPLTGIRIPKGYFRWTVTKAGAGKEDVAPETESAMHFDLTRAKAAPAGMVYVAGGWSNDFNAFIGWVGPYNFAPYYMDRHEVTNREYQEFADRGGYENPKYWPAAFLKDGRTLTRSEGMKLFRDGTGRPGPSTWVGGHYPEGKANDPVSGVSWFEAAAYAKYAGKDLPVLGQWYQAADLNVSEYTVQMSNLRSGALSAAGSSQGLGPYGTYDMAGNVREWIANPVDGDVRFILGGSWKSPNYLYTSPEALSPYDRSEANGFRCVRNLGVVPPTAAAPVKRVTRNFAAYKPVSDAVFRAYTLLYAYPRTPLHVQDDGIVKETEDWREEKVTFDAAYNGERMAAYLFLPRRVKPPYETILFFPSARVMFLPPDSSELGDVKYFDYILQSGRAVLYPVYEDTYERRLRHRLPGVPNSVDESVDWYKDAARSLDYLDTRPDIDKSRIGYLGVSMGAADGVVIATLLQDRLRTAVFLDGGYFMVKSSPGFDQADFAPRMKKPVLMVNGRYDYTFPPETSQDPLFRMLGTPAADKRHVVLDTPHDVSQQRGALVREVLGWLDRYLGTPKLAD